MNAISWAMRSRREVLLGSLVAACGPESGSDAGGASSTGGDVMLAAYDGVTQ